MRSLSHGATTAGCDGDAGVLCAVTLAGAAGLNRSTITVSKPHQYPSAGTRRIEMQTGRANPCTRDQPQTGAGTRVTMAPNMTPRGHGMIVEESKHFATIGYDDTRGPRRCRRSKAPLRPQPGIGKRLSERRQGRC